MDIQQALESGVFTVKNLTAAINQVQAPKTRLAELGIFQERGIRTTTVEIEFKDNQIILVPEKERGDVGTNMDDRKRTVIQVKACHLPLTGRLMADDVLNVRAFGTDNELEELQTLVNEKFEDFRFSLDATLEYHRIGALLGKVTDASGTVILDLFKEFGLKEADAKNNINFNKPLRSQFQKITRDSKANQKGIKGKRYRGFASPLFMDQFVDDPTFEKAYELYQNGAALRDDVRGGIYWQGVYWEEFDVTEGGKEFLKDGEALVFPEDKPNLFLTRFAPANYVDTVGSTGYPFYGNSEIMEMKKGIKLEAQSNPINICTSPLAVRRITMTPKTQA